jgi:thioredoxin-related protein
MRRRTLMTAAPALALAAAARASGRYAPVKTDHGWTQSWFSETFLRLPEDLADAKAAGKRLAVVFDQRGCPYCVEMHTDHLTRPAIADYIRARFMMIQLDLHGSREVLDFDGEALEERQLARKWRVTFTPTIVFFPDTNTAPSGRNGREIEVARMHGLLNPDQFLGLFTFVAEKAYADGTGFPAWWAARSRS